MYSEYSQQKIRLDIISKIIILYYFVSPFLYLLRTLYGDATITAILLRTFQPLLLVMTLAYSIIKQRFIFNPYSFTLFLVGIYGLMIAFLQENTLTDLTAGYFHYMTGVILFIYFSRLDASFLNQFMKSLTLWTILSNATVLAVIYIFNFMIGIHIYLGLACQILLVVFFYNFQKKKYITCLISLFLILVSGKRGVFVALCGGMLASFFISILGLHFQEWLKFYLLLWE